MQAKKPRRTAERILEVTLDLFNRFGEPNVSTTLISAELHISPGNLYYHYPAKDELINALFDRYEKDLLGHADTRQTVEFVAEIASRMPIAIGCFCADESRCHRSRLYKILQDHAPAD